MFCEIEDNWKGTAVITAGTEKEHFPLTGAWFGLTCYWYHCRQLRSSDLKGGCWGHPKWAEEALIMESEPWLHRCYRPGAGYIFTHTHTLLSHATAQKEPKAQRGKTALPRSQSLWFAQLGFEPEVHSAKICWSVTVVEDTECLARSRIGAPTAQWCWQETVTFGTMGRSCSCCAMDPQTPTVLWDEKPGSEKTRDQDRGSGGGQAGEERWLVLLIHFSHRSKSRHGHCSCLWHRNKGSEG